VPGARAVPLTYHSAQVLPTDAAPIPALRDLYAQPLSFDLQAQGALESLRFPIGSFMEIKRGNGRIFWAAEPVELAEGLEAEGYLYSYVAARLEIQPQFDLLSPLSPGVMVYPITLGDSILYIMVSDSAADAKIELRDKNTGTRLTLDLPAEHAALALIGKKEEVVMSKYGF